MASRPALKWFLLLLSLCIVLPMMISACTQRTTSNSDLYKLRPEFYSANIDHAVGYLQSRYNSNLSLICEAQGEGGWTFSGKFWTMDKVYWLGDNRLASMALRPFDANMSEAIADKVASYSPYDQSDLPDILAGKVISATPWIRENVVVNEGSDYIVVGSQPTESILAPWDNYGDVILQYSLLAWNVGDKEYARELLTKVIQSWDGTGIRDGPEESANSYAVYKLALFLIALQVIEEPFDHFNDIERQIWANQNSSGGIVTGINLEGYPSGGPNTETTALVLLMYNKNFITALRRGPAL